ncbi:hypothetical protein PYW07_003202 [Mythimna separata]|uniref:Uncharacterized protein n=1 Tax=Mythimna separata TaxID=271217 RepID=A0AAD8DRR8_MYTSE|nr:hypothetical protein PYW07_003202 [Mythimna separata]
MLRKVLLMLCSSALISAGVIGTDYAPTGLVSYSSTPVVEKTFNTPVGYTKIIQSQPVYQSVLTTKERLSSYSSHTPVIESQPVKTTITYSEAPLVSHMSFTGLGASYAW